MLAKPGADKAPGSRLISVAKRRSAGGIGKSSVAFAIFMKPFPPICVSKP